jgi:hypothetical protein
MMHHKSLWNHRPKIRRSELADEGIINHVWLMLIAGAEEQNVSLLSYAPCGHKSYMVYLLAVA